jgi:hypothetical protein
MNTVLTLLLSFLLAFAPIPEVAIDHFKSHFSNATKVKWEKNKDERFEVHFVLNEVPITALYDELGLYLEYKRPIPQTEIPLGVLQTLRQQYANLNIAIAYRVTRADESKIMEVWVKNKGKKDGFWLDDDGRQVQ